MKFKFSHLRFGPKGQLGVGLIEVMIAMLVLAIGILGLAALQATTLKNAESSSERTQAVILSYSILDGIRADPVSRTTPDAYNFESSTECAAPTGGTLRDNTVANWVNNLKATLPAGCGSVSCDNSARTCTVTVNWDDSRAKNGSETESITTAGGL